MPRHKVAYAALCPRCEGSGHHQGGRCFQCHGDRVVFQKSSKVMRTFQHKLNLDGKPRTFVTWGRDLADATRSGEAVLKYWGYM